MRLSRAEQRIEAEYYAHLGRVTQRQLDGLVIRHGVPPLALARDPDGWGAPIGTARVERSGPTFEFRDDGSGVFILLARDEGGEPADVIAWEPNAGWFASWRGRLPLLGWQNLERPSLGDPMPVFLDMLPWFRGGREGVVVLDRKRAWSALEGVIVQAETVEEGLALRKILTPPKPKIVVPKQANERVAA